VLPELPKIVWLALGYFKSRRPYLCLAGAERFNEISEPHGEEQ